MTPKFTAVQLLLLRELAGRYIWWKSADESMRWPQLVISRTMNIGDYEDVTRLVNVFAQEVLRETLRSAEIGEFNERSWHYWHYRLGLAELGTVPPLPLRKTA